jgi:hypothetical protein
MTLKRCLFGLLALAVVGGGVWWQLYLRPWGPKRLDIDRDGGTILVFEVDGNAAPKDADEKMDDLARAVHKRIDQWDRHSITVRPVENRRVEVVVPRDRDHEGLLKHIESLLGRTGRLEFRILANQRDDEQAFDRAEDFFRAASAPWQKLIEAAEVRWPTPPEKASAVRRICFDDTAALQAHVLGLHPGLTEEQFQEFLRTTYQPSPQTLELREPARAGQPPPPPQPRKGQHFILAHEGSRGGVYAWCRVSDQEVLALSRPWEGEERWLRAVRPRLHMGLPFRRLKNTREGREVEDVIVGVGGRECLFLARRVPGRQDVEYFVLTRLTEERREVTGKYLDEVYEAPDHSGKSAISFRLTKEGGDLFHELTSRNAPTDGQGRRHLAILLDEVVLSAPSLNSPIRDSGQITGNFTQAQVKRFVDILRSGALPLPLKPIPVDWRTVEPKKP